MNSPTPVNAVRTFVSGATRNLDDNKLDYEGFLSPLVLEVFARYMNSHRKQADGKLRDSDNWQKGMGKSVYMKSLWRHFMDLWQLHRGHSPVSPETGKPVDIETAISACIFNLQGYLHEHLQPEKYAPHATETTEATIAEQTAQCVRETFEAVDRMFPVPDTTCGNCHRIYPSKECQHCPSCGDESPAKAARRSHPAKKKNPNPFCTGPGDCDCPSCIPN